MFFFLTSWIRRPFFRAKDPVFYPKRCEGHLEQFVVAVRRLTRIRRRFRARFEALIAEEGGR